MGNSAKLLPIFILGSAIGGCSMAGSGDYFADDYAYLQQTQMPHYYGGVQNDCAASYTTAPAYVPAPSYRPAPQNPCGAQALIPNVPTYGNSIQGQYAQGQYGQGQYGQGQNGCDIQGPCAPQYYGGPYGHGAYVPPSYGSNPNGLRGKFNGFKPHAYGNLGVVNYEVGEELYGAQARLGYQFNRFLGAEVEGSLGLSDETQNEIIGGIPVDQTFGVKNSAAAFGVLRVPLFGKLSGYGRAGYHRSEVDQTLAFDPAMPEDRNFSVDGIAYGSGLEYEISPRTSLRLDYTNYDFDGPDADSVSLAISRKF